jgi:hypothetical protein
MASVLALAAKGHAFDHGHGAQRAKRLFQSGLGHTEFDDLSLALGYPWIVELAPDVDGDAKALTTERIDAAIWRPEPWPRNLAVKAARALATGDPATLDSDADWRPGEEVTLLAALFERPPAQWKHVYELMFLCEALAGGGATIRALLDSMETQFDQWVDVNASRRTTVMASGLMLDRLSPEAAAVHRPRMETLLEKIKRMPVTSLPLRAFDIVLNGAEGYERIVELDEYGRDRNDAIFLDRTAWKQLAVFAAKPMPHMLPSVQWVVLGGLGELKHAGNPAKYSLKGSKKDAHRWLATQFERLVGGPEVAGFLKKLTAAPKKV